VLRGLGSGARCGGDPVEVLRGSGWPEHRRWHGTAAAEGAHLRRISVKFRRGHGSDWGKRAQGETWAWGGALAGVGRSGGAARWRGVSARRSWAGAVVQRLGAALWWQDRALVGAQGPIKGMR
jgi:hypothetical protein